MDNKGYTYYFVTNVIERPDGYTFSGLQTATEELNRLLNDNKNAISRLRRANENYDALAKEIYPSGELTPSDMVLALRSIILERSQYIKMYIEASSQARLNQTQETEALKKKLEQSQRLVDNLGDSLNSAQSEQTRLYEELEYRTGLMSSEIEILKKELEHAKAENSHLKQRSEFQFRRAEEELANNAKLRSKISYYETAQSGHKFNDKGVCIICDGDAEEWDAPCFSEILQSEENTSQNLRRELAHVKDERDNAVNVMNEMFRKIRVAIEKAPHTLPGSPDLIDELIAQRNTAIANVLALMPYVKRLQSLCESGDTVDFYNPHDEFDASVMRNLLTWCEKYTKEFQ